MVSCWLTASDAWYWFWSRSSGIYDGWSTGAGLFMYISFHCQFSLHWMFQIHLSLRHGIICKLVAVIPNGRSLTTPYELKKNALWETSPRLECHIICQVKVMVTLHVKWHENKYTRGSLPLPQYFKHFVIKVNVERKFYLALTFVHVLL
jgi:hypothetical protein